MTTSTGISPEFLALISKAADETVSIQLASRALAIKMRQRLHSARKHLMRAAQRPNATLSDQARATLAESIETSIDEHDGIVSLIVRPRDSQFREALRAAGVTADEPQTSAPHAAPSEADEPADVLSNYLKPREG